MEELAKKYLKELQIIDGHITGYLESEKEHDDFLTDIDSTTGGFVKKWSETVKDEGINKIPHYQAKGGWLWEAWRKLKSGGGIVLLYTRPLKQDCYKYLRD